MEYTYIEIPLFMLKPEGEGRVISFKNEATNRAFPQPRGKLPLLALGGRRKGEVFNANINEKNK